MEEEKLHKKHEESQEDLPREMPQDESDATPGSVAPDAEQKPLAKIQADLNEAKDTYLRLYSEFENYKRRTQKERVDLIKTAGVEVILAIIPVLDDFERAFKAMQTATDLAPVKEGVELIHSKLKNILEAQGLKTMEATGTPFDADLHEAITNIPAPSEDMKGKVIEDVQKGYYLNAKVIVGQ